MKYLGTSICIFSIIPTTFCSVYTAWNTNCIYPVATHDRYYTITCVTDPPGTMCLLKIWIQRTYQVEPLSNLIIIITITKSIYYNKWSSLNWFALCRQFKIIHIIIYNKWVILIQSMLLLLLYIYTYLIIVKEKRKINMINDHFLVHFNSIIYVWINITLFNYLYNNTTSYSLYFIEPYISNNST